MKKNGLVILGAFALCMALGCGKDDDEPGEVMAPEQMEAPDEMTSGEPEPMMQGGMMRDPVMEKPDEMMPDPIMTPDPDPEEEEMVEVPEQSEPNQGWIGGRCESASACDFEDALCLGAADGFAQGGVCSQACDKFCPDRDGENAVTFCVTTPSGGRCLSRCDFDLFPGSGCRDDLVCRNKARHQDPNTVVPTCVAPDDEMSTELDTCLADISAQGTTWSPWAYMTQSPEGEPNYQCTIDQPIRIDPVINGVSYLYYNQSSPRPLSAACELAAALYELGEILKDYDITQVLHIGTFNCRKIRGKDKLSQHSYARAIDIWGFVDAQGERYILEEHWEHDTTTPQSRKAQVLYEIGQRMHDAKIFHNILTPNYNAGHDNHFHVDLEPGASFIGAQTPPEYYYGNERWDERCHGHD